MTSASLQDVLVRAFAVATRLPEDSDPADPRNGLLEQFQTLADEFRARLDNPVTLPPGRARLVTSPLPTGSAAVAKTMGGGRGSVCLAARAVGVPGATMTSTLSATSSAARAGSR